MMMDESESEPAARSERILVVLDDSHFGREAVEAAAGLAAERRAELRGLFIEDVDLLHLAGLPFAREIAHWSGARPLDLATMERTLRSRAEQARMALAETAERLRVQWSFETSRGQLVRAAVAAASEAEMLVIGCEGRVIRPAVPTGPRRPAPKSRPVLTVYDGAAAGARAVLVAARLVGKADGPIIILLAAGDPGEAERLRTEAIDLLNRRGVTAAVHETPVPDAAAAAGAARALRAKALLWGRDSRLLDEAAIETLINYVQCLVVLV